MSFGKLGAMGRGMGHLGALGIQNIADWFVDQVNGLDTNPGNSQFFPFKTLAAAKTAVGSMTGQRVALKCGSVWKEEFSIGTSGSRVNGTKILSYGSAYALPQSGATPDAPFIDGSETIPSGDFTLASGQTVTYQANVTLQGSTPGAPGSEQRLVWEDGRFLLQATSIANCEATAGSFFYSSSSSATPTVYVHASDGSDPSTNGKVYDFNCRFICIDLYGDNCQVTNVRTRRQRANNGSMNLNGDACWFTNVTAEDGHKHCSLTWEAGGYLKSAFKNAYNGTSGSPNFVVFNKPTGTSRGITVQDCAFLMEVNVIPNSSAVVQAGASSVICHCNAGDFGLLSAGGNTHTGPITGYGPQNVTGITIDGDVFSECVGMGSNSDPGVVALIRDTTFTITGTILSGGDGHAFACNPSSGRATVTYENCAFSTATYEPVWFKNSNVDYTLTNCQITAGNTGSRFPHGLVRFSTTATGCTLTVNGCTLTAGISAESFYNLASDTVYTGNNNTFIKATNAHWQRANVDVATTLAGWQSASGQDANSTLQ
jgi:hypothetical protein